ncbi:hypothetical protein CAPTEDRAFT_194667 [Capitella teleta]|uniref:Uncharacterized protein n=1 Tax=Capitella teleta TaxID=283909 RepID=R7U4E4_CAPTE|nr:hypothetical protein CAPTEDRAFT_194667 [Capitella teleta]|eukprot:ELU00834.1 hypothetical protein CAPTEDRAFT_194667 [Capitella teleta]
MFIIQLSDSLRHTVRKYNLQERKFIANTSMDPTLSLLMATMGQVKANDLVFDPFVGSGKPSRKGQKWRFRDETILNNLRQYNLEKHYVDAFVADFTSYKLWCTDQPRFDAIITDPPYGVREPSQKLGKHKQSKSQQDKETAETSAANCYPTKTSYHLTNMLLDLLDFAARTLTLGGRLVFWMPIVRDIYVPENIPHHPCLKLVSNSEQIFFIRVSRRLITMEKVTEFNKDLGGASVEKDHYAGSEFREIFFTPNEDVNKKQKMSAPDKT